MTKFEKTTIIRSWYLEPKDLNKLPMEIEDIVDTSFCNLSNIFITIKVEENKASDVIVNCYNYDSNKLLDSVTLDENDTGFMKLDVDIDKIYFRASNKGSYPAVVKVGVCCFTLD